MDGWEVWGGYKIVDPISGFLGRVELGSDSEKEGKWWDYVGVLFMGCFA